MYARKSLVPSILLALLFALLAAACAAPMDASKSYSRAVISSGGIVQADELRVAEYLAYYDQKFPEPTDSTLGLDLRTGSPRVAAEGGEAWLQIGVQAKSPKSEDIAPLNLALVIDRSGSMSAADKMPYLKQSLRLFLQSLAPEDIIAIVAYDDTAQVILPAQKAGDRRWIQATVDRIEPGGSTNLQAGMMLGFQEVDRNFDIRRNNRVILLTDGVANVGVTDPARIAQDARAYNDKGIYLSTIGLGRGDYNDRLLSTLAAQGKGAYHFVDSAAEMDKVFRKEVAGLMQKAAESVSVTFEPAPGVRVLGLTGYEGAVPAGPIQIKLQDMGTGDSQVVLAHLSVAPGRQGAAPLGQVELRYTDLFSQRDQSVRRGVTVLSAPGEGVDPVQDIQVLRNVTIQRTAEGLKEIDLLYKAQRYQDAWNLAYRLERDLRRVAAVTNEQQMYKDADMMRQYQDTLAKWLRQQTGRSPVQPEVPAEATPLPRLLRSAPTPAVIEVK